VADEKRQFQRYRVTGQLTGTALTPVNAAGLTRPAVNQDIRGEIPDISAGGLCLLTDDHVEVSDAVRCEIRVPSLPVAIPALMNVRWTCPNDGHYTYRLGLQFLV
jgi:hypothetical protein